MLPRLLIIDDLIGAEDMTPIARDRREIYCERLGLRDLQSAEVTSRGPVADAVFCSGQKVTNSGLENSIEVAEAAFRRGWPNEDQRYWTAVIVDMRFGEEQRFGLKLIQAIRQLSSEVPILVVSSLDQFEVRRGDTLRDTAQRLGAQDFLAAPGPDERVEEAYRSSPANLSIRLNALGLLPDPEQEVVGTSLAVCQMLLSIRQVIRRETTEQLLLLGESGSGKSHLRNYVRRQLALKRGIEAPRVPCEAISLGGTSDEMQMKTLFGTAGATNVAPSPGAFQTASEGMIFLDEIGELAPTALSNLLGPLQPQTGQGGVRYREVRRLGAQTSFQSHAFVLAATNRNLDEMAELGTFNGALLQRFDSRRVLVPSLKERLTDVSRLIEHFLSEACGRLGVPRAPTLEISKNAWREYAEGHSVRQLASLVYSAVSRNPYKTLLTEADIFPPKRSGSPAPASFKDSVRESDAPPGTPLLGIVQTIEKWSPPEAMTGADYFGAFEAIDAAAAKLKLNVWRSLLEQQQQHTRRTSLDLLPTVKTLLGNDQIPNSKSGDIAKQLLQDAGIDAKPEDPILGQIWERRRGRNKKVSNSGS
jgi:DNA-binding NtrC family response regulator